MSFGAKGKSGDDVTHRLSLSLSPVVAEDGQTRPARVNARTDRVFQCGTPTEPSCGPPSRFPDRPEHYGGVAQR
ncbi:hypothetical protein ACQP2T_30665 [Nonomuraea sp. CA-143628]|uniref:hypothetical protein n=1 Tax=Nonomuraea sp. CA-143628 TaxID=3239997 RepID=UPI003D94AF92